MEIKKIGLCCITVSNLEESKKFYIETLGLKTSSENKEFGWLELSGTQGGNLLGIGQESEEGFQAGGNAIVSFVVDDVEKAQIELESKGVEFLTDIMEIPGEVKLTVFTDPDENQFFLVQELK